MPLNHTSLLFVFRKFRAIADDHDHKTLSPRTIFLNVLFWRTGPEAEPNFENGGSVKGDGNQGS